ncbi:putative membrane protein (TIGR04086 family) [Keratinibaculum paraultunense]|uniref:Putative membrane protein (TIGR04086 family) n=1 Tax=Keratinibaculum paraultunense TaxID=1278232 RepID=A0A4R3KVM6_9FIRM|nr:TIGR04086 family membrane protein [Keratinibaculum paraultunense]QQY78761.1 TIGR04086 family membrane protein [Keratinibaculum paraultunense]TCS89557.1 putative membrane protein (TIGR04086 family) [Keratinibaculum paraultunense]
MKEKVLNHMIYLFKGLIFSMGITILLLFILSLILLYTPFKESNISLLNTIVMIISITIGSIYVSINIGENGWINGGILGILYFLMLILLNYLFLKPFLIDIYLIGKLVLSLVIGIIGGIIGINLK